jgi:hypothetical protein
MWEIAYQHTDCFDARNTLLQSPAENGNHNAQVATTMTRKFALILAGNNNNLTNNFFAAAQRSRTPQQPPIFLSVTVTDAP